MASIINDRAIRRLPRLAIVIALDAAAAALTLYLAVSLRMNGAIPPHMLEGLRTAAPLSALFMALTVLISGTYRRSWRYVSISDLMLVAPAAIATPFIVFAFLRVAGIGDWQPLTTPAIHALILLLALASMRVLRRLARERGRSAPAAAGETMPAPRRVLLAGDIDRVDAVLRSLERSRDGWAKPVGILDGSGRDVRMRVRGVPIVGTMDSIDQAVKRLDARGQRPDAVFLVDGPNRLSGPATVRLVSGAQSLGLSVGRVNATVGVEPAMSGELDLRFMDLTELLGRPQARRDRTVAAGAIAGRRVLVTGAGGTIGSELVRQIAALGPAEITLLDHSEFALYSIDLEMAENFPALKRSAVLCSIRQRDCLLHAFEAAKPELVFHAAALKHVPLVESNPCAGVLTNVIGTRNVADAARLHGTQAMIQVSTDKAVNPVGIMGATKRLGELYCQALDLAGSDRADAPQFMTVRFGNVLGSSGSLIPLLQRQLSRRAPLTVTHPEIKRFFMTVHEAVQLILHSSAQAVGERGRRGRIFVLDMGEPIKILDIARRMIRLAGLEPDVDVKIDIVGLRPGEKLYEELFDTAERRLTSTIPGVFEARPNPVPIAELDSLFDELRAASLGNHVATVRELLAMTVQKPDEAPAAGAAASRRPAAALPPTALAGARS